MNRSPRLVVNATNVVGSGATALCLNLIPALGKRLRDYEVKFLLPDTDVYRNLPISTNHTSEFFRRRNGWLNNAYRLKELYYSISLKVNSFGANVCLSLGDMPTGGLSCPEVVFLHNPNFVYSREEMAGSYSWSLTKSLFMRGYFKWISPSVKRFVVQSPVMKSRLQDQYHVGSDRISIISQPTPSHVSIEYANGKRNTLIDQCTADYKLLFLAQYYPHKNHNILLKLRHYLEQSALKRKFHIFVTISDDQFSLLEKYCKGFVTNLGPLRHDEVSIAFNSSSALFLPTLLESYGLVYLEALTMKKPIITSDRDFSHWIANDYAVYFDPLNPASIINALSSLPEFLKHWDAKCVMLPRYFERFPSNWQSVADEFTELILRTADSARTLNGPC